MAEFAIKIGNNIHQNPDKNKLCYKENDIVECFSNDDIDWQWAQMLIRGTHNLDIPFIPELFSKYFDRFECERLKNGHYKRRKIKNPTTNFRAQNSALKMKLGIRYVDKPKVRFRKPLQDEIKKDIEQFDILIVHEFGDRKIHKTVNWGREVEKHFFLVYIDDKEFDGQKEIDHYKDLRYKINFKLNKNELELNKHSKQIRHSKTRLFFENDERLLIDLVEDKEIRFPNRFHLNLKKDIIWQQ